MKLLRFVSQATLTCAGALFVPPGGGHLVLRALAHAAVPQHAHAVIRPEGAVAPEADLQGRHQHNRLEDVLGALTNRTCCGRHEALRKQHPAQPDSTSAWHAASQQAALFLELKLCADLEVPKEGQLNKTGQQRMQVFCIDALHCRIVAACRDTTQA